MAKRARKASKKTTATAAEDPNRPLCGIVMPIADHPEQGYRAGHWKEVNSIITEALTKAGYASRMVSYADETRVIQDTIVKSLNEMEIVVVDVSSKNPNVMFELGIRLTFNKPVVVIKDDNTDYAFDIGIIDTIPYPADLRYQGVEKLKADIITKVKATHKRSKEEGYNPFLGHFGILDVPTLERREGSKEDLILDRLDNLQHQISMSSPYPIGFPGVSGSPISEASFGKLLGSTFRINPVGTSFGTSIVSTKAIPESTLASALLAMKLMNQEKWPKTTEAFFTMLLSSLEQQLNAPMTDAVKESIKRKAVALMQKVMPEFYEYYMGLP